MKILSTEQIREHDKYTIENEPILSIDLMERAAAAITNSIVEIWPSNTPVVVFAGPGNNGGDALAVARMLAQRGYEVQVYVFNVRDSISEECQANLNRLTSGMVQLKGLTMVQQEFNPPKLDSETLVVDGLFGTGMSRPLTGGFAAVVKYINTSGAQVVSIDLPSGMMTDNNSQNIRANIIRADLTLTIGGRKLCMMMADMQEYLGEIKVLDIQLSQEYLDNADADFSVIEEQQIHHMMKSRNEFAHKGDMGNALIIAGSYGMAGAAVLATRACLRSGVGKVTVHTPKCNYNIMQISVPEAVLQLDPDDEFFSRACTPEDYDVVGVGPGLGQNEASAVALIAQLRGTDTPAVVDADAINILASHQSWLRQLPAGIIFTPHPKELTRMIGHETTDDSELLENARELARSRNSYIILKGHYTAICMQNGKVVFNSTGNAGMATAGSGDVLTGIITALIARGYSRSEAAVAGVYLHGLAGDLAAQELGMESLTAGDIIDYLPKAFLQVQ